MKKIAFTLNTCICMVLFLPVLDCVKCLCTVHVYRGRKRVLFFLKVFKRSLGMYLSPCSLKGKIPSTQDIGSLVLRAIFAKKWPHVLGFLRSLLAKLEGFSDSNTSQRDRARVKLQEWQVS